MKTAACIALSAWLFTASAYGQAADGSASAPPPEAPPSAATPAPSVEPPPPPADGAPPPMVSVQRAPEPGMDRSEAAVTQTEPPLPEGQPPAPLEPEDLEGTPREGTLPTYFIGLIGGFSSFRPGAESRGGIGIGGSIGINAGLAIWDQLVFEIAFGRMTFDDKHPFQAAVQECQTINGTPVGCSDPQNRDSVIGVTYFATDVGYQKRFRPGRAVSLLPGAFVGYLATPGGVTRGVQCNDCTSFDVPGVTAKGVYVGPSFKATFGQKGMFAVGVRSQIPLTGDLAHMTLVSVEVGAP